MKKINLMFDPMTVKLKKLEQRGSRMKKFTQTNKGSKCHTEDASGLNDEGQRMMRNFMK